MRKKNLLGKIYLAKTKTEKKQYIYIYIVFVMKYNYTIKNVKVIRIGLNSAEREIRKPQINPLCTYTCTSHEVRSDVILIEQR